MAAGTAKFGKQKPPVFDGILIGSLRRCVHVSQDRGGNGFLSEEFTFPAQLQPGFVVDAPKPDPEWMFSRCQQDLPGRWSAASVVGRSGTGGRS